MKTQDERAGEATTSSKREIFEELCESVAEMKADREGTVKLRKLRIETLPNPRGKKT